MPELETPEVNASFDAAFDSAVGDSSQADSTTDASLAPMAADSAAAGAQESPIAEEAQPEPEIDLAPGETALQEGGEIPEGKGYHVAAERLQNLKAAESFYNDVSDFAPDVETARAHFDAASDLANLQSDLEVAPYDPKAAGRIMDMLDGTDTNDPQQRAALRASFVHLAGMVPQRLMQIDPQAFGQFQAQFLNPTILQRTNPQAYQRVEQQIGGNIRDSLYRAGAQAHRSGTPIEQNKWFKAAQWLDSVQNNRFVKDDEIDRIEESDPLAAERANIQAERERLEGIQRQAHDNAERGYVNQWNNAVNAMESHKRAALGSIIEEALKPAAGKFPQALVNALRLDVQRTTEAAINANPTWVRNQNIALRNIQVAALQRWRQGIDHRQVAAELDPQIRSIVDGYTAKARGIAMREAAKLLSEATKNAVAANQQQHARSTAAQQRRGGAGGGVPSRQPNARDFTGKSFEELWKIATQ